MKRIFPEPKSAIYSEGYSKSFTILCFVCEKPGNLSEKEIRSLISSRFESYDNVVVGMNCERPSYAITISSSLPAIKTEKEQLYREQGYVLTCKEGEAHIAYEGRAGFNYALSALKKLLIENEEQQSYCLPLVEIVDYPSIPVRAVAPTFSWYTGYGRIGFDCQLFGKKEWIEYLHDCVDHNINQLNMVMYGYWPFTFEQYPETVCKDVPVKIWNAETQRWLHINYTHPNIVENYIEELIAYAHTLGIRIFAYVGLNSYNGAYSIKHPEKRMVMPPTKGFLNDFDSLCLSDEENIAYIVASMRKIASLGFDGFSLEESEEGFWFCECEACKSRWHAQSSSPGEAKHKANMWLLGKIYEEVRSINPNAIIGIRAYRQPPLEKDPAFLEECVASMPADINLFWAPALYVPPTEFKKWIAAFGKERIWGRDTESNAITSTMGRLFRIFESNVIRYQDEPNVQVIERDIEQHISSVAEDVHGINGFMFELYGYFMHQWAHANYGWGSTMDMEEFFQFSCESVFGQSLGEKILYLLKHIITIHESQIPLYTTPFPFQKNVMTEDDIPAIKAAITSHPGLMQLLDDIENELRQHKRLSTYLKHFAKIRNAMRRNRVIYDLVLVALQYEKEIDQEKKDQLLSEILRLNELDFSIAKEMFFDLNPVSETGVKSCMFPYHEMKRLIYNIRNPQNPDNDIICSGIEALGWLWL